MCLSEEMWGRRERERERDRQTDRQTEGGGGERRKGEIEMADA